MRTLLNRRRWFHLSLLTVTALSGFLGSFRSFALDPAKSLDQYNCRSWTRQNGLPAHGVNSVVQAKDGYLWLGMLAGPVRFDGINFDLIDLSRTPQLRITDVRALAASKQGDVWVGFFGSAFALCKGRDVAPWGKEQWGGVNLYVNSILESRNGDIWLGSQSGAARLTAAGTFEFVLPPTGSSNEIEVNVTYEDSRGRIWIGTTREGFYYWQDGVLTKFSDSALDGVIVRAIAEDKQGNLWVGTENGIVRYDSKFQKLPVLPSQSETRALLVDRQGVVWAGTSGGGLVRYLNGVATQLRKTDGLADDFVSALAEDREGSLWIGTRNGLSQLSDVKIPTYGKAEGLTADVNVSVVASHKGGLWVATGVGFTYFDGGNQVQSYGASLGLGNAYIITLLEAKNGDIYLINGDMDVLVFSGGKIVARYPNKSWPTALVEDAQGVLVAVDGKLCRVGPNSLVPLTQTNGQPVSVGYVFNMVLGADGSIWAAASGDGVCQVKDGNVRRWPVENGGRNSRVLWICKDNDGVVWAGLSTGIARLKDGQIRFITHNNGLFNDVLTAMVLDDHGYFWIDSDRGIFRVSRQCLNDFCDGKTNRVDCEGYNGPSAVKSVERNQQKPSGCKTLDGRIWFPTAQGIVMVNPTNIIMNLVPPQVHVDVVVANGHELDQVGNAVVGPGKGELELRYAGLSFMAPEKIQYQYKLEGYDKDWVPAGTRRSAFYTNLKPGDYDFQVRACNEDGVWSNTIDHFAIVLQPHYYQTGWFYSAMGLLVAGVLFGVYGLRVKQLQLKQKRLQAAHDLLEVKVRERTAELAGEISWRKHAQVEIEGQKVSLEKEIEERKHMELVIERAHKDLMIASRSAGQAEVASSVLHNVGNVLNSVNVSTNIIADRLHRPYVADLAKAVALIREHQAELTEFIRQDQRGQQLLPFLEQLAGQFEKEQNDLCSEARELVENVGHIKEIVAMQQNYATFSGVTEKLVLAEVIENALKLHAGAFARHSIALEREYEELPPMVVDKHKLLQIMVNLLHNAKYACDEGGRPDKKIVVRIKSPEAESVAIEIADNGIGILPENLTRIFAHGFTTRKSGHGFGLHSAALAATEMNGSLVAHSEGLGQGATFTLELPGEPKPQDS